MTKYRRESQVNCILNRLFRSRVFINSVSWFIHESRSRVEIGTHDGRTSVIRAHLSVRISVDRHKAACTLIALHAPPIDTIPLHADSERGCAPLFARDYRAQRDERIGTILCRDFSLDRGRYGEGYCSLLLLLRYSSFSRGWKMARATSSMNSGSYFNIF